MYKRRKKYMSYYERCFYNIFKEIADKNNLEIQPQINLATIIKKKPNTKYYNDLYRNIDFGLFTKDYEDILLLIEINDKTHDKPERIERDKKVKRIIEEAGIKLIRFHTKYQNEKDYVINKVLESIK